MYNSFDILIVEGLVNDPVGSDNMNMASISRSGREKEGEYTPANTVQAESDRLVYAKSRDVTASHSTQTGRGRQARVADDDAGKSKNNRCLCHSELKCNVNVNQPIHMFTSSEGVIVKVYDNCVKGVCSCIYKLQGEKLQLKPYRSAYLVSLGTAECKKVYEPLVSNVTDGFKIVYDSMNLLDMHYECENYKSVYEPENKA